MSSNQYRIGTVSATNASQIIIGASTDFSGQCSLPCVFKVDLDGESTYSVGTILTATRIILAANYLGSTNSGVDYMIVRDFTTYRGYARINQGDADFAEILSQETIDPIDEDIGHIMSGNASVEGTTTHHFKINTNASAVRLNASGLTASRDYTFPDQNATLAGLSVPQTFTADQTINASLWVKGNASVDGNMKVSGDFHYNKTVVASALATDPNVEGATGLGVSGANFGWVKLYDITNATYIYTPFWRRG